LKYAVYVEKSFQIITIFEHKNNYIPEKISRRLPIIVS